MEELEQKAARDPRAKVCVHVCPICKPENPLMSVHAFLTVFFALFYLSSWRPELLAEP